jgi:putative endonuclease
MPQIESLCYVYILYSPSKDKFYVGYTCQLADRFLRHQSGRSKSSKAGRPWLLVYLEGFETSKQAYQREVQIKRRKSRNYLLELISGHKANPFSKRALARAPRASGKVAGSTPKCYTKGPCGSPSRGGMSHLLHRYPPVKRRCFRGQNPGRTGKLYPPWPLFPGKSLYHDPE